MAVSNGILGPASSTDQRIVASLDDMADKAQHLRGLGYSVVLTSGSFDLIHLGHVKYLERAKECGDFLAVGVDCDAKIRRRKGDDRPMVPEEERLQMLAYQRPVDFVYLKRDEDERWGLIRATRPDVLVLTADHSYGEEDLQELRQYCVEIKVLPRQASVTTSERIRQMYMHMGDRLGPKLAEVLPGLIDSILRRG
jgi:D-glycero-beta-D-manno-heptose 1-phosphate adenylyltransferase